MKGKNLRRCTLALLVFLLQGTLFAQSFNIPASFQGRPNAASALPGNCWEITPNVNNRAGAIWSNTPLNLANPFDLTLHTNLTPWGADGMAFVLQQVGTGYVGHGGNAMGFANNISTGQNGISPSFAVELDIWDSRPAVTNDIAQDHLAIVANGNHSVPLFGPTQARTNGGNITDGICRAWRMVWNPVNDNFQVWYGGVQIFNVTYDITANIFGGSPMVTWGITGSTGGAATAQTICYEFADAGGDTASCAGSGVQLTATGGNNYVWWNQFGSALGFNNQNVSSPVYTPFPVPNPQTVRVTVQNSFGCTDRDTINIGIDQAPSASNAGPDQDICALTTTSLAGNNPAIGTGNWNTITGPATLLAPGNANSGVAGLQIGVNEFEWVVTNTTACPPERDTVVITVYAAPSAAAAGADQNLCGATNTTITAINPVAGTGQWNVLTGPANITTPSSNTSGVTGLQVGMNVFEYVISSGPCTPERDTIVVNVAQGPTIANAGPDVDLCNVTSFTMQGNAITIGTGTWTVITGSGAFANANAENTNVTGLGIGQNEFVWTSTTGPACVNSIDTVSITVWAAPTVANAGPDQTLCGLYTTNLAGNAATSGTAVWTQISGSGTIVTPGNPTTFVNNMVQGTHVFQWAISNGPVCPVSLDTISIVVWDPPSVATAGPNQTVCSSDTVQLAGNTPGIGTGQWSITTGSGTISNAGDPNANVTALPNSGTVSMVWTISNGSCPPETDQMDITVIPAPTVDIQTPDTTICFSDMFQVRVDTTGNTNWNWLPTSGINLPTDLQPMVSPGTATEYFLTVTDPITNCSATDSITVSVNALPADSIITLDTFICNVDTIQLNVSNITAGVTYVWTPSTGLSNGTIANPMAFPITTTDYEVAITETSTGCTRYDTINIAVFSLPLADFQDTTLCEGEFLDLEVEVGDIWLWTSTDPTVDGSTADSVRIMPTTAQDYSVFVVGNFGNRSCSDSAALHVEVNSVTATAAPDYSLINPGQSVNLTSAGDNASAVYTYSWDPVAGLDCDTCQNPVATPEETTTYTVTVTDTAGCSDTYEVEIEVEEFLVPNVFTPNGDGMNDVYIINYYGDRVYETKIYDRWGKLVFETNDPEVHWSGKMMNSSTDCQEGVYYMVLFIVDDPSIDSEKYLEEGHNITLLR